MEPGTVQSFYARAEVELASIRNGILVFVKDRSACSDLDIPLRGLKALAQNALAIDVIKIETLATECVRHLENLLYEERAASEPILRHVLDTLAEIEALLIKNPFGQKGFTEDISDFVDESFDNLRFPQPAVDDRNEIESDVGFEIDDETLEVFRSEASELLEAISANLNVLTSQPDNREALWKMRRSIHTFKGAAGIVGLNEASQLAHRVEDLLDQIADNRFETNPQIIDLLALSSSHLNAMAAGMTEQPKHLDAIYADFDRIISENATRMSNSERTSPSIPHLPPGGNNVNLDKSDLINPPAAPIIRVSLDRLDELQMNMRNLAMNGTTLAEIFEKFSTAVSDRQIDADVLCKFKSLMAIRLRLTNDIQDKLEQIRMVRFGMLSTRLNRAVQVTCQEENKKADVVIENGDLEIDTQIVDALVEPLLHLLRNAVVHGIESPETRRLIGKPEKGRIGIRIQRTDAEVIVSVWDNGRGIATAKLREKALSYGAISQDIADSLSDDEAFELMFLRGVTTAETLNLNAGRGVGMSIVKESIESRGGSISITSEAQKGTTFSIRIPLAVKAVPLKTLDGYKPEDGDFRKAVEPGPSTELGVLIIDDSAIIRQMVSKMVENAGWRAFTAVDGLDAIETLSVTRNRPDIILTDLEMPRLNGYELLEALKHDLDLRNIPVIMITSRTDETHREKALELGAVDFLTKPLEEDALITKINQLCFVRV